MLRKTTITLCIFATIPIVRKKENIGRRKTELSKNITGFASSMLKSIIKNGTTMPMGNLMKKKQKTKSDSFGILNPKCAISSATICGKKRRFLMTVMPIRQTITANIPKTAFILR